MVIRVICTTLLTTVCSVNVAVDQQTVVYGKYYSVSKSGRNTQDNSFLMYRPQVHNYSTQGKLPVIIEFHGGGFTSGDPITSITPLVQQAINNGLAVISVGYRLVATKYYYGDDRVEELINVDAYGRLTIDKAGRTMDDYQIRRGRQEYITKCIYDAAQMIEHLIARADEYGIDMHRITFAGFSAGGAELQYLTWVYHQWNIGRYTPRGIVYDNAQLDETVVNMVGRIWKIWTDDVGEGTLLSSIVAKQDCGIIVGNEFCGGEEKSDYNLCNMTYQFQTMSRFCGDSFENITLAEVRDALVWPTEDPEIGKGMEVLWCNSLNMQKHQPKPFYLYVRNSLNGTDTRNVAHHAMYARNFAKYAGMAGINYTVYYTDYHAMTAEDVGDRRFTVSNSQVVYNYHSSHGWANQPGFNGQHLGSDEEKILYHCFALGVDCSLTPSRTSCQEEVDHKCSTPRFESDCASCIHTHMKTFKDAGCTSRWLITACPYAAHRFV